MTDRPLESLLIQTKPLSGAAESWTAMQDTSALRISGV